MTQNKIMPCGEISEQELEKIRQYTRKDFDKSELYIFSVVLCDNDVDRDYEMFSPSALAQMAVLFKGKTGIFDHSMKSHDQSARIFDAWVEKNGALTVNGDELLCLKAKAYMIRTQDNADLIKEIDAGIKKEVSVSCAVEKAICSVCGENRKLHRCEHINGKKYANKTAYTILDSVTDAYEWSFVAVPAQRNAGVIKSFFKTEEVNNLEDIIKGLGSDSLTVNPNDGKRLKSYIQSLEEEAELGKEYKSQLALRVKSLCAAEFPELNKEVFSGIADVMTSKELKCFEKAFEKREAARNVVVQLGHSKEQNNNDNKQFLI